MAWLADYPPTPLEPSGLSGSGMLAQAAAKELYDDLINADLVAGLQAQPRGAADLIVCAIRGWRSSTNRIPARTTITLGTTARISFFFGCDPRGCSWEWRDEVWRLTDTMG